MPRTGRPGLSAAQKSELWTRWKNGESLSDISFDSSAVDEQV